MEHAIADQAAELTMGALIEYSRLDLEKFPASSVRGNQVACAFRIEVSPSAKRFLWHALCLQLHSFIMDITVDNLESPATYWS